MNSGEASWSSTSHGWDYEVFLSFRGEDTRTSFTDHLYTSLVDAAIRTFRDNEGLHVGEQIGPQLLKIIESSKICIPVFSKNYASSKWCLIELAQMLQCSNHTGQRILPIFYDVPPEVVKHQTESFGVAFLEHERNFDSKTVQEWKEALKEVGKLKGWEKAKIHDGHEAKLVKEILVEVCIQLNKNNVDLPHDLVGMNYHEEEMSRILNINNRDVRAVGISGMGGIGKTTIAKLMFNHLAEHFQPFCSFIGDIREKHKDLVHLQKQLISDLKKRAFNKVENVGNGKKMIKDMFCKEKVLIVLDDVVDISQLHAVAGESSWFGPGSRIIVTTRDKAILRAYKVYEIYEPKEMSPVLSLRLFSLHAFKEFDPPEDFDDISKDIVGIGGGLPLFFEVIGSLLSGYVDNKPFWESTSAKLKNIPNKDVKNKLKISYDTLDDTQRAIFLDIACHFILSDKRHCIYMWDGCGFFGENGIGVLASLSLVRIGADNEILMHDLLRDLGRDIVRHENAERPEKRSRLWLEEDAEETLIDCKGTPNIQTLALTHQGNSGMSVHVSVPEEAFLRLPNLRYLQMERANLEGSFKVRFPKLGWLSLSDISWTPSTSSTSNWCLKKLVVLKLFAIDFPDDMALWNQLKMAANLKVLHLQHCKRLTRTPDFSSFPDIEMINIDHCEDLVEISPSILHLERLTHFSIRGCSSLLELPKELGSMKALTELILDQSRVEEIPVLEGSMKKLQMLRAVHCRSLAQISSIGQLQSLQHLYFDYCVGITELPGSIGSLVQLQHLSLDGCTSLVSLPDSIGSLVNLRCLSLRGCKSLVLPLSVRTRVLLKRLTLVGCTLTLQLPKSVTADGSSGKFHSPKMIERSELPKYQKLVNILNANGEQLRKLAADPVEQINFFTRSNIPPQKIANALAGVALQMEPHFE